MCIRDSFYRVQARGESLAAFVHRVRDAARILGVGLSEEEVVQIISEGVTPQEKLRLVFAERPRRYVDLDKLCVMPRAIQGNDETRGSSGMDLPELQMGEARGGPSRFRQVLPSRAVSYTHLDVYKRQYIYFTFILILLCYTCLLYTSRCV